MSSKSRTGSYFPIAIAVLSLCAAGYFAFFGRPGDSLQTATTPTQENGSTHAVAAVVANPENPVAKEEQPSQPVTPVEKEPETPLQPPVVENVVDASPLAVPTRPLEEEWFLENSANLLV